MRNNSVRQRIQEGKAVVNGWVSIGSSYSAEGIGHSGVHSVTIDLQHGMLGFSEALTMLQAISSTPAIPMVRVPELNEAKIMHLLDAGAYGIICPMISSAEEAAKLVAACRYPPLGNRSFGPSRGLLYGGQDYVAHANDEVMVIPMIETAESVDVIDEILAVEGIDMVYLGPNDLAFAMDGHVGQSRPVSEQALDLVRKKSSLKGIPTGIFCPDAGEAKKRLEQGFNLVTPGNDFSHLTRSMQSAVHTVLDSEAKGDTSGALGNGY